MFYSIGHKHFEHANDDRNTSLGVAPELQPENTDRFPNLKRPEMKAPRPLEEL